jgi:hypothetical protein
VEPHLLPQDLSLSHPVKIVLQIQMLLVEERKLDGEVLLQLLDGQVHLQLLDGQVHLLLLGGKVHLPNLDGESGQHPCPQKQPDPRPKMILVMLIVEPHLLGQDLSTSHPVKIVPQIRVLSVEELSVEDRKLDGKVHLLSLDGDLHKLNLDGDLYKPNLDGHLLKPSLDGDPPKPNLDGDLDKLNHNHPSSGPCSDVCIPFYSICEHIKRVGN